MWLQQLPHHSLPLVDGHTRLLLGVVSIKREDVNVDDLMITLGAFAIYEVSQALKCTFLER